jgi:hypothetical protein
MKRTRTVRRALRHLIGVTLAVSAAAVCSAGGATSNDSTGAVTVEKATPEQRLSLAQSAQAEYDLAMASLPTDPVKARGHFASSAEKFQAAIQAGAATGAIYYDLGNALVQAGEPARGVGAYLDAQRLMPADARVAANLAHARALLGSSSEQTPRSAGESIAGSWRGVSSSARGVVASTLWLCFWGALLVGVWTRWPQRVPWRSGLAALGAASVLTAATLAVDEYRARTDLPGVIVTPDVVVRKGNGDGFAPAFAQPAKLGTEFTLKEERPGWYCIEFPGGESGWVRATDAIVARGADH